MVGAGGGTPNAESWGRSNIWPGRRRSTDFWEEEWQVQDHSERAVEGLWGLARW